MTTQEAMDKFKTEICEKAKEIDPSEGMDWFALSYGFFLALGLSPEVSEELSIHVRYKLHYWEGQ